MLDYAISIWAPTRYLEELAVSPVQAGVYIAIPNIADFCSQFVTGAIEVSLTTFQLVHALKIGEIGRGGQRLAWSCCLLHTPKIGCCAS